MPFARKDGRDANANEIHSPRSRVTNIRCGGARVQYPRDREIVERRGWAGI